MNCVLLLLLSVGGCVVGDVQTEGLFYYEPKVDSKFEDQLQLKAKIQPEIKDDDEKMYNTDFREEIVRPCVFDDWQCIRMFLAANSDCKPAYGPDPDPLFVPYDKILAPSVNATVTVTNNRVTGLKGAKITDFYVNKYTGNVVIAFNVRDFNQTTPMAYFTYQRTGKESVTLADFSTARYDSITFTAIIPKVPHLRLELAEMHPDVHDGNPAYVVGPRAFNITDPDVIAAFAELTINIKTVIREQFNFQAYLFTGVFIEKSLCDFGVDVYNNYIQYLSTKAYTITSFTRPLIAAEPIMMSNHY